MDFQCLLVGGMSDGEVIKVTGKEIGDRFNVILTHEDDGIIANDIYTITNQESPDLPGTLFAGCDL